MVKKYRAKTGDIFIIPIADKSICYGQVTESKKGVLRIVTFDRLFSDLDKPAVKEIINEKLFLLTDTMDAKIWNGDWAIYGNTEVVSLELPKPKFKLGVDPVYVTNYEQTKHRRATLEEQIYLDFKFTRAPIGIQKAMEARFGFREWEPEFDKLTFKYCVDRSKISL